MKLPPPWMIEKIKKREEVYDNREHLYIYDVPKEKETPQWREKPELVTWR